MNRFNLVAALEASPRQVLNMLADEAASFEQYYRDRAAEYTIGEPDEFGQYAAYTDEGEYYTMCEYREDASALLASLGRVTASNSVIHLAASTLANDFFQHVHDPEMEDELRALADYYHARAMRRKDHAQ